MVRRSGYVVVPAEPTTRSWWWPVSTTSTPQRRFLVLGRHSLLVYTSEESRRARDEPLQEIELTPTTSVVWPGPLGRDSFSVGAEGDREVAVFSCEEGETAAHSWVSTIKSYIRDQVQEIAGTPRPAPGSQQVPPRAPPAGGLRSFVNVAYDWIYPETSPKSDSSNPTPATALIPVANTVQNADEMRNRSMSNTSVVPPLGSSVIVPLGPVNATRPTGPMKAPDSALLRTVAAATENPIDSDSDNDEDGNNTTPGPYDPASGRSRNNRGSRRGLFSFGSGGMSDDSNRRRWLGGRQYHSSESSGEMSEDGAREGIITRILMFFHRGGPSCHCRLCWNRYSKSTGDLRSHNMRRRSCASQNKAAACRTARAKWRALTHCQKASCDTKSASSLGEDEDENDDFPYTEGAVQRWSTLVSRWYGIQLSRSGDVCGVRRLMSRIDIPEADSDNMYRAAIRFRHFDLVDYFLDEVGKDINVTNKFGMTAVWLAVIFVSKQHGPAMFQYLMARGADITSRNKWGSTVVHTLAACLPADAIPMMRLLSENYGLALDATDKFGVTPLHWAAMHGTMETAKFLVDKLSYTAPRGNWNELLAELNVNFFLRPSEKEAARRWREKGLHEIANSLTPLGVAILHNHVELAVWFMGTGSCTDALKAQEVWEGNATAHTTTAQCKRRSHLFSDNCRDLMLIAKTWPNLLPPLLNTFSSEVRQRKLGNQYNVKLQNPDSNVKRIISTSSRMAFSELSGWGEKKYEIKDLYGHPDVPTASTPLSLLLMTNHAPLFDAPVIQLIIKLKWNIYGWNYCIRELTRYCLLLASFHVGFIHYGFDYDTKAKVFRGIAWCATAWILIFEEGSELFTSSTPKAYFTSGWNLHSLIAYGLVLSLLPMYLVNGAEQESETMATAKLIIISLAAVLLYSRLTEHLAILRTTSIYIAIMREVIFSTVWWALLFWLFQISFAIAFYSLLQGEDGYENLFNSLVTVFAMCVGTVELPFSHSQPINITASILLIVFMLLVGVVFLNLLIAIMTTSYDAMVKKAPAQALMSMADALLKWEGSMGKKRRMDYYRRVVPRKGRRSHIKLSRYNQSSASDVFIDEGEATVIEARAPKAVDPNAELIRQLAVLTDTVDKLKDQVRRSVLSQNKATSALCHHCGAGDAEKDKKSTHDASNKRSSVQFHDHSTATTRKSLASTLPKLRILLKKGSSHGASGFGGISASDPSAALSRDESGGISKEEVDRLRERAAELMRLQETRRAATLVQAAVRGHLARMRLHFKAEAMERENHRRSLYSVVNRATNAAHSTTTAAT